MTLLRIIFLDFFPLRKTDYKSPLLQNPSDFATHDPVLTIKTSQRLKTGSCSANSGTDFSVGTSNAHRTSAEAGNEDVKLASHRESSAFFLLEYFKWVIRPKSRRKKSHKRFSVE